MAYKLEFLLNVFKIPDYLIINTSKEHSLGILVYILFLSINFEPNFLEFRPPFLPFEDWLQFILGHKIPTDHNKFR